MGLTVTVHSQSKISLKNGCIVIEMDASFFSYHKYPLSYPLSPDQMLKWDVFFFLILFLFQKYKKYKLYENLELYNWLSKLVNQILIF